MKSTIFSTFVIFLLCMHVAYGQVKLSSYPAATATIYLDFDGEEVSNPSWNNGVTIQCLPAALDAKQITEVFSRVSEDFRPFNINITTDYNVFLSAPLDKRIRVIITPTSWFPNVGGISYTGSFSWGDDTPCFVFCNKLGPNNPKMIAECCSHESGHTLGLSHQSKYDGSCNLTATYNDGNGAGEIAWAPIMGNSYYRNMSGWNNGPTPYGCANNQDNLSIITTQNGFGYRADDYSDDIAANPTAINLSDININGLISSNNDKDAFTFSLSQNSNFRLDAKPFSVGDNNDGADLDIRLSLYDAAKNLVQMYNPDNSMAVTIDTILNTGIYYLLVDGTGNCNASEYGSIGSYNIRGISETVPVCTVTLNGSTNGNQHTLNWNMICYETIDKISIQSATDAASFNDVQTLTGSRQRDFSYLPYQQGDLYYRLKIVSTSGRVAYSNTVLLRKTTQPRSSFAVSTYVHNEIRINATEKFQYHLTDINGNSISTGNAAAGFTTISASTYAAGMYILQLSGATQKQTIRIVKQ